MNVVIATKASHVPAAYLAIPEPIQERDLTSVIFVGKDSFNLHIYQHTKRPMQWKWNKVHGGRHRKTLLFHQQNE